MRYTATTYYALFNAAEPWKVSDMLEKHIELLQRNIVEMELRIERNQGKNTMSQETQAIRGDKGKRLEKFV
jgi:predicted FMN-binding regulatory protein PaiB